MIKIIDKKDCCGCNACGDICSHQAITFNTDIEGFWYPKVDMNKCVECGLCEKVCPIINVKELKKNDFLKSICYAAEHKNLEIVFDSTSGGLFSALADTIYKNKGYVGGAIFNDDFSVRHYISNDKRDLEKLRSSKYLQSDLTGFFKEVKKIVCSGDNVLVCGTPCQMAALRAYLRKDYENLIIVDFICRGINSPKVWKKYLDSFEERYGSKVVYCKAKSKEYGWRNLTQKVRLANGKEYYETYAQSNFTQGYLRTNAYCRPSCYDCRFKGYPRIADITLADFWGIEKINKSLEKNLGTSLVMINTQKGKNYFEKIKFRINCLEVSFEEAEKGNPALNIPLAPSKVNRSQFFEDLNNMSFLQLSNKYIQSNQLNWKSRIKIAIKKVLRIIKLVQYPKIFYYNSLLEIINQTYILPLSHTVLQLSHKAEINKNGCLILGSKRFKGSKLESRFLVDKGGKIVVDGHNVIGYGSDIEVFSNAVLEFKGDVASNIGTTIICGERIVLGKGVKIGRNVTIRDNNGGHYLNRAGYKNSRPVIIGDKVWLCEGCTIMPGVKIGDGAIVGAHAFVTSNVPAHAMVSGNPAHIVDEDVLWKY